MVLFVIFCNSCHFWAARLTPKFRKYLENYLDKTIGIHRKTSNFALQTVKEHDIVLYKFQLVRNFFVSYAGISNDAFYLDPLVTNIKNNRC